MLLAPGPVQLHPEVQKSLSLPMIHHRTPEFDQILARVLSKLPWLFQTINPCFMLSSTGSGGMECLLVNVLRPGEHILAIVSGKFGERWAEMATTYGAKGTVLNVEWGKAAQPHQIEKALIAHPDISIVLCQACETSSGVSHPIKEIGSIIHQYPNTLFLVDGITALGAYPIEMDAWHIDGLVGGSQKAFMLPTGMSFLSFSQKAWNKINSNELPRFYFDIRKELKANQNGETYFSSNVSLIRALDVVMQIIEEKGLHKHYQEISQRAQWMRKYGQQIGLKLYAESPSDSITAFLLPNSIDGQKLRSHLEKTYAITIMGGQDQAKGKIIRIGHMGYIQPHEMFSLLENLIQSMQQFDSQFLIHLDLAKILQDAKQELATWSS